jgi:hypothetical protein
MVEINEEKVAIHSSFHKNGDTQKYYCFLGFVENSKNSPLNARSFGRDSSSQKRVLRKYVMRTFADPDIANLFHTSNSIFRSIRPLLIDVDSS